MTTENIENHMAYTCKCGGVNFALLKSGGIECNKCSSQLDGVKWWAGGMGAQLARAIKAEDQRDALQAKLAAMEPVAYFGSAYVNENGVHVTTVLGPVAIPQDAKLYTAPKAQPDDSDINQVHEANAQVTYAPIVYNAAPKVAQPLTDEQVRKWWASENGLEDCCMCKLDDFSQVVRAVESKHGIGGQQP
jgi:hypothetical protein